VRYFEFVCRDSVTLRDVVILMDCEKLCDAETHDVVLDRRCDDPANCLGLPERKYR
jgi:hypothetical protein